MCKGDNCPLKENCYRYKAEPDERLQSYFMEPPYKEGECKYLIAISAKQITS